MMKQHKILPVEGHSSLVKDMNSKGIINTDTEGYHSYMEVVSKRKAEKEQSDMRISKLEDDISDVKSTLNKILEALIK